jgi:thioesterase domain-containing protein/acyl carrier protein
VTNFVSYMFLYRQMCAAATDGLPHIRRIFLLGEPIVRSDLELFNEKFRPGAELISRFGSSEYGAMTVFPYRHGEPIKHDVLPIGKPIHEGTLFLLDEHGEEVPQGELGEVTFSTPLVPHGYHNDPERSAKVFMADHKRPGHWRYHTGDLGFLDENGDVTVVGRKDEQVKVRGYTVRPHEVEQMLVEHPGVALAGVVPFTGRQGNVQIAAFFQPADGAAVPEGSELRAFMNERAPGFMIPSAFLPLAEMPLSPNGKVARGRLPDPLSLLDETVAAQDLAHSATEKELVRIWSKVLGHGQFTLTDDFFDMGGDSLQAMSMVTEVEAALQIKLPFESLMLDGASIAVMARRIDAARDHGTANYVTVLKRGKDRPALFAAHVIGGHLSDYLEVVTGLHAGRPVFGIHPRGMAGKERPDFSMQGLARHCVTEMRTVQPEGPYHLLGYSFGARLCVEIANQLQASGQTVDSLVMIDPQPPNGEPGARSRAVHRPLREGSVSLAMARLLNTVPASMGLRDAPRKIDEAHLVASLAFRPAPIALPRVLIVFASGNPYLDIAQTEWQRVFGGRARIEVEAGSHMEVVRGSAGQAMGRKIEAWLNEAAAMPVAAVGTAEPDPELLAG